MCKDVLLMLEALSFLALFFFWIIVFFVPHAILVGLIICGNSVPYFVVALINEQFREVHTDLQQHIYGLKWYEMRAHQRKVLLQVMIIVNCPAKLLTAGPFHDISYETLAEKLKKLYSFGMVTNKIINKRFL